RLFILPAPLRFPSGSHSRAVQSQQRRLGRSSLLRVERIHEPEGNRVRKHHAPPRRDSPWSASRARRSQHRSQVHRRTGGNDGQLASAQGREGGAGNRRSELPQVVAANAARAVQSPNELSGGGELKST